MYIESSESFSFLPALKLLITRCANERIEQSHEHHSRLWLEKIYNKWEKKECPLERFAIDARYSILDLKIFAPRKQEEQRWIADRCARFVGIFSQEQVARDIFLSVELAALELNFSICIRIKRRIFLSSDRTRFRSMPRRPSLQARICSSHLVGKAWLIDF